MPVQTIVHGHVTCTHVGLGPIYYLSLIILVIAGTVAVSSDRQLNVSLESIMLVPQHSPPGQMVHGAWHVHDGCGLSPVGALACLCPLSFIIEDPWVLGGPLICLLQILYLLCRPQEFSLAHFTNAGGWRVTTRWHRKSSGTKMCSPVPYILFKKFSIACLPHRPTQHAWHQWKLY